MCCFWLRRYRMLYSGCSKFVPRYLVTMCFWIIDCFFFLSRLWWSAITFSNSQKEKKRGRQYTTSITMELWNEVTATPPYRAAVDSDGGCVDSGCPLSQDFRSFSASDRYIKQGLTLRCVFFAKGPTYIPVFTVHRKKNTSRAKRVTRLISLAARQAKCLICT